MVARDRHFRNGKSPSFRTSPLHPPRGWPHGPRGGPQDSSNGCGGWAVDASTPRPALTPGGSPGPGHFRAGAAGRFPGKGYRGREQSAPFGEGGPVDGGWGGRPLSGDPQDALCRLGPSQRGDPPLAKGGCCSPSQRPPLQLPAPHLSPFSSSSAGRAKGPAFPPRGSSTKPGRGRGRAIPGSTRVEAARAPRRCPAPARAPPRAAQLQQPRSWVLADL